MKLLDIMKKYDRCVIRESAKLAKIYTLLLKESEEVEDIETAEVDLNENEDLDADVCSKCGNDPCTCEAEKSKKCPDCGNDPCTCEAEEVDDTTTDTASTDVVDEDVSASVVGEAPKSDKTDTEADVAEGEEMMTAEEFFTEDTDEDTDENTDTNIESSETTNEDAAMSAEDFFKECETSAKQTDDVNESETEQTDTEKIDESDDLISASEFFAETDDIKTDAEADVAEGEEMMTAEEFFTEDDTSKETTETVDETEETDKDDEVISESLKSYRRLNHRLFIK